MTTTSSTHPTQSPGSQLFNTIYEVGFSAAAGALAGYLFYIINPVGGAVFGAAMSLTGHIGAAVVDRLCIDQTALKVAFYAVSFIASVAVGFFATTAAGFPLTVLGSVGMVLTMVITNCVLNIITGSTSRCLQCLGGAGLALKERFC
jgi:hypothetical protein